MQLLSNINFKHIMLLYNFWWAWQGSFERKTLIEHWNLQQAVSLDKTLHLFDKHSGEEILDIDHEGLLTSCDYSNNSRYYAVTQDIKNEAIIYDARTDNKFDTIQLDSTPTCLEFSPNSQRIAIGTLQVIKI